MVKLDDLDYEIAPGIIRIGLSGPNDPITSDLLMELHLANNKIYVEGNFYEYLDEYEVTLRARHYYLELQVLPTRR